MNDLLNDFRDYKINVIGLSENSMDMYLSSIKGFLEYRHCNTKEDLINTTVEDVTNWLSYLAEKNISGTTRNNRLSVVKELFKYLEYIKGEKVDNKIFLIPQTKIPIKESICPTPEDIMLIYNFSRTQCMRAFILVGKSTTLRISEILQIDVTDILDKPPMTGIIIKGKGNKEKITYLKPEVHKACLRYINGERQKIIDKTHSKETKLFINSNGKLLHIVTIENNLKKAAKEAGIPWWEEMTSHKLRHAGITEMLNSGIDIKTVSEVAGHSNISTTNRYTHSTEQRIKDAIGRMVD